MWLYEGSEFDPEEDFLSHYVGFVYCITEISSNKKYIGKKWFWSTRKLPPLKGKKRKRTVKKQSDWRSYFGSNEELKNLVVSEGAHLYKREIIRLCKTKGECSYYEAKEQFIRDVLLTDEYFNEFIGCKIHSSHVTTCRLGT